MLTDSRSSQLARHEYFCSILCDLIGFRVGNGEFLSDEKTFRSVIEGICFRNAERYFDL